MPKWSMVIDLDKCVACQGCSIACRMENNTPVVSPDESALGRSILWNEVFPLRAEEEGAIASGQAKFLTRPCMHCDNPPCVQVCPVGATFITPDGVILVDSDYCIGCRYCIQGCPYGARYLDPIKMTAEKCTFCYHRVVKGMVPACVEVCPTQARIFGELKKKSSPLVRFMRMNKLAVLKPSLNTEPKVYYANFDMEIN